MNSNLLMRVKFEDRSEFLGRNMEIPLTPELMSYNIEANYRRNDPRKEIRLMDELYLKKIRNDYQEANDKPNQSFEMSQHQLEKKALNLGVPLKVLQQPSSVGLLATSLLKLNKRKFARSSSPKQPLREIKQLNEEDQNRTRRFSNLFESLDDAKKARSRRSVSIKQRITHEVREEEREEDKDISRKIQRKDFGVHRLLLPAITHHSKSCNKEQATSNSKKLENRFKETKADATTAAQEQLENSSQKISYKNSKSSIPTIKRLKPIETVASAADIKPFEFIIKDIEETPVPMRKNKTQKFGLDGKKGFFMKKRGIGAGGEYYKIVNEDYNNYYQAERILQTRPSRGRTMNPDHIGEDGEPDSSVKSQGFPFSSTSMTRRAVELIADKLDLDSLKELLEKTIEPNFNEKKPYMAEQIVQEKSQSSPRSQLQTPQSSKYTPMGGRRGGNHVHKLQISAEQLAMLADQNLNKQKRLEKKRQQQRELKKKRTIKVTTKVDDYSVKPSMGIFNRKQLLQYTSTWKDLLSHLLNNENLFERYYPAEYYTGFNWFSLDDQMLKNRFKGRLYMNNHNLKAQRLLSTYRNEYSMFFESLAPLGYSINNELRAAANMIWNLNNDIYCTTITTSHARMRSSFLSELAIHGTNYSELLDYLKDICTHRVHLHPYVVHTPLRKRKALTRSASF